MSQDTPTKKRGGLRPNSGRPKKPLAEKVVKCQISMTPEHHAATEGDRAGIIRRALDLYFTFWENGITVNPPPGDKHSEK